MSSPWVIDNIKKTCRTVSAMDWVDRPEAIILVNNNKYSSIEDLARTESNKDYYIRKWGGHPGNEKYTTPFGV